MLYDTIMIEARVMLCQQGSLLGREGVFKDRLPGALPLMLFTYLLHCCFSDVEIFSSHSSQCFIAQD